MRFVIQCAATKSPDAKRLRTDDGREVLFVADPATAPSQSDIVYARPDDPAGGGRTWRDVLLAYNTADNNLLGLLPAYRLYANRAYGRLVAKFGARKQRIHTFSWLGIAQFRISASRL